MPSASSSSSSSARIHPRTTLAVAFSLALASLSVLAGCPGSLEGDFPGPGSMSGSGGSSTGSGGTTGSGGSGTGSGGSGSGGSGSGSGGSMGMGCDAPNMIFKMCADAACHSPGPFFPDLSGDPWANLVGKKASFGCTDMNYVNSTKPAAGVLLKRLMGSECGNQMPQPKGGGSFTALTAAQIQCVTDWITSKL